MNEIWDSYVTMMLNGFIDVPDKDEENTEECVDKANSCGKHKPHLKGREAKTADWRHRLHGSGLFHYNLYGQFGRKSFKMATDALARGRWALYKEKSVHRLNEVEEDYEQERYIDPVVEEFEELSNFADEFAKLAREQYKRAEQLELEIVRLKTEKFTSMKAANSFWRQYKINRYYADKALERIENYTTDD